MKTYPFGVDAHSLLGQQTGVATYVHNLVRELQGVAKPGEIELFSSHSLNEDYHLPVRVVPGHPFWTTFWLGTHFLLRGHAPQVMLYPAHALPWYSPSKNVVVIHDLAFELFPDHFTPSDLKRLRRLTHRAVRKADHLIAVSKSAKDDLVRLYGVSPDKITVVYHGCDHELFKIQPDITPVLKKYALNRPYLVSVGTLQKRKNHLGLLRAWETARHNGLDVDLVLVGGKGWLSDELFKAIADSPYNKDIHQVGYVDREELPALYQGAVAFVLPSLYEGFGMPVLEAMACGTPAITSNTSSLGELYQDVAITVDPTDKEALVKSMREMVENKSLREELSQKGLSYAEKFTWEKTATETYQLLCRIKGNEER
jgi:glycosyltransferase involved in cell wall biosynthesis